MKNSIKAAILSGLGYPGLGHFPLKRYGRGAIFMVAATWAMVLMLRDAMRLAQPIADGIARGEIPLDPQIISRLIGTITDSLTSGPVATALLICWALALADAVVLGHLADKAADAAKTPTHSS